MCIRDRPNIVLNLDGLNQNKKADNKDIFKIEEKGGADALNSLNSSTESDDEDFSPQNS